MPNQYVSVFEQSAGVLVDDAGKTFDLDPLRSNKRLQGILTIENHGSNPVHFEWTDVPANVLVLTWPLTSTLETEKSKMVTPGRAVSIKIEGRYITFKCFTSLTAGVTVQTGGSKQE